MLARYIFDHPATVAGRRVLDLGAGCGVVGIAAALAGADEVIAADIDRNAAAALELNAAMNGVALTVVGDDLTAGPPPAVDLVLAGDVYYDPGLALRVTAFLDRCAAAGIEVLIGDPGRAYLPRDRLRIIAEYPGAGFRPGQGCRHEADRGVHTRACTDTVCHLTLKPTEQRKESCCRRNPPGPSWRAP